jgi:sorbitol-specific phosphotransferase system component IIBC
MDDSERTHDADPSQRRGSDGIIFDIARKAVATSVKSLLSTEEGVRALIGAIVPKEIGQYVGRELSQLRTDVLQALVGEMSRFLNRIEPAEEIKKLLSGLVFDVNITVGVRPREDAGTRAAAAADTQNADPARKKAPKPRSRVAPTRKRK